MKITVDLFEPGSDRDAALEQLTREFTPLHVASWEKVKQPKYGKPYDMNVGAFVSMWLDRMLKVFIAYEDAKPVGYLTGMVFRPLEYKATVFQVSDWYTASRQDVEDELFDYLYNALRILGCDEVLLTVSRTDPVKTLGPGWNVKNEFKLVRYTRG